jgi:hypothetical protein
MILYLPSFSQSSIGRQYYWGQRHGGVALAMDPWMFNVCAFVNEFLAAGTWPVLRRRAGREPRMTSLPTRRHLDARLEWIHGRYPRYSTCKPGGGKGGVSNSSTANGRRGERILTLGSR